MRNAKSETKLAAAKAAAKIAARVTAKRLRPVLARADDGLFAVQSVIASGLLLLMSAGCKIATQLHPPDI
ncbi:MAG: hypothetical protein ACJ763_03255 [Bdellovibrionia bacterium]